MSAIERAIEGVSSIDITTDNLKLSTEFYTEILGGKLLNEWSKSFKGDDLYRRIFGKELQEAAADDVDPKSKGVPDISETGNHQVTWNFIMFDNILIKLVQYSSDDGAVLSLRDERTSAAIITNAHICFWVQDDINLNKYIRAVEKAASERGMKQVVFNRPVPAENETERATVPEDQLSFFVGEGELSPLSFIYFKGPSGEQLEAYHIWPALSEKWRKSLSAIGSPSTAFMTNYKDNDLKQKTGITAKLFGVNHVGIRVTDLNRAVQFYTKVLGGHLLPMKGDNFSGDVILNVVFQKEMFESRRLQRNVESMFIPDIGSGGSVSCSLRFVQIGATTVELLVYGDKDGNGYNPCYDWTSPAYCNTMAVVFSVQEGTDFNQFLHDIEAEAEGQGFPEFTINKSPTSVDMRAFRGTPIAGYKYALAKGPSGEQLAFCQFSGSCRKVLHDEIVSYGGVSTMFPDLKTVKQ